ncbi:hypothetical protein DPMN_119922 [Dreissena polymorpha]|uniref:Uncharacterized protein n=2 Tax=Dreissena polymorpha TaxID=45954 RepID=A0A9D4GK32_DREPO|nr:hypothetical protein DPMN_119922 [Dreissena polymorpha]
MGTWHLRKNTSSMYGSADVDFLDDEEDSESYKESDEEDINDKDVSLTEEEDESDQERD